MATSTVKVIDVVANPARLIATVVRAAKAAPMS
jgi:hypothetical protein